MKNLTKSLLQLLLIRKGGHVDSKLSDNGVNNVIVLQIVPDYVSCDVNFDHGNVIESVVGIQYLCIS